jgi:hypothetical protein
VAKILGVFMFYRRKHYLIKEDFVDTFNKLFNEINLPNQLKHGTRFIGRWMMPLENGDVEIFAIWEYDNIKEYERIESNVRSDKAHINRIREWYESQGGKEHIFREHIRSVRNEEIFSTVTKK